MIRFGSLFALVLVLGCRTPDLPHKSFDRAAGKSTTVSALRLSASQTGTVETPELYGTFTVWDNGHTELYIDYVPYRRGDLDCDGTADFRDINPFMSYLSNFTAWQARYPGCNPVNGDINRDCEYPSLKDLQPFISLLQEIEP